MNQPIKTVLSAEIETLFREAESVLNPSLIDNIKVIYTGKDGNLDPIAEAIIQHINSIRSALNAVEELLKTPVLKRYAGVILYGALLQNLSFSKLCNAANEIKGIPKCYGVDMAIYTLDDDAAVLEAIDASRRLKDIIADLRVSI